MMIIDLVAIGVLQFLAGTFFEYTVTIRIIDGVLYILAIAFAVIYLQKRLRISNTKK
ncbi:hypothetical protein [Virgibacillus salexigens]|uniref:hypothetical protein n=1 Tax=Virgibacillus salexigens TaxID=61016 RepID=UPI00190ABC9D|nr:hypothetical protein [Virgibacillus salexigens]